MWDQTAGYPVNHASTGKSSTRVQSQHIHGDLEHVYGDLQHICVWKERVSLENVHVFERIKKYGNLSPIYADAELVGSASSVALPQSLHEKWAK